MISGLRQIKSEDEYQLSSFDGFFRYFQDLMFTYLNSLYYSVAVMATLGDSKIIAEGGFTRLIVTFEVGTALSLTIFKIGEYHSQRSSAEMKAVEKRIINEVKKIDPNFKVDLEAGFLDRILMKFKTKYIRRRQA